MACEAELSTAITAVVGFTVGFQPRIVPSSVANKKRLGAEAAPLLTRKSAVALKTVPVGVPAVPSGAGIVTVRGTFWSAVLYSVDVPVPLLATQIGLVPLEDRPHGLTTLESVMAASPGTSDTRLV